MKPKSFSEKKTVFFRQKLESPWRAHFLAECRYRQEYGSDDNDAKANIVRIENMNRLEQAEGGIFLKKSRQHHCRHVPIAGAKVRYLPS